jgi:hypothetical protein
MTVIFLASLLTCDTEWLAGETAANNVNCSSVLFSIQLPYVTVDRHTRPMLRQNLARVFFNLTKCDCFHSRPFEAETEPTDAAKQIEDFHGLVMRQPGPR